MSLLVKHSLDIDMPSRSVLWVWHSVNTPHPTAPFKNPSYAPVLELEYDSWEFGSKTQKDFAYIWQSKWVGVVAIETARIEIHFLSNVFMAVTIVVSWTLYCFMYFVFIFYFLYNLILLFLIGNTCTEMVILNKLVVVIAITVSYTHLTLPTSDLV